MSPPKEAKEPLIRLNYAIPMPYIPSTGSETTNSTRASPAGARSTDDKNSSRIEIDLPGRPASVHECTIDYVRTCKNCSQSPLVSPSKTLTSAEVHSRAVVRYAEIALPVPLSKIETNTNLRNPPKNWLQEGRNVKGFVNSPPGTTGFSSFKMANDFFDCLPNVDVISDGENIKKLLKMPFSNSPISMIVHKVGKTLLIDDFDIHQYLLRRSATEWEWLRKFFAQTILQQIDKKEGSVQRKNCSNSALQERNLVSKFLYRSLLSGSQEEDVEEENLLEGAKADDDVADKAGLSALMESLPPLPDPEIERNIPQVSSTEEGRFARNFLWTFEDIRMLIGSNMPIFGDEEHPCVSLRLRDMKKPINVLTGMDYWLDNLMCQVPEVVMCYHLDGIVQRYELIKTEDLPTMDGSKFSPKIVRNIAQNILSFLKSKAAKEGHTYWLFKGKNDDIVKLYDLTSLSQQDSGIEPKKEKAGDNLNPGKPMGGNSEPENPFQTPVSLLLYRLARNILENGERKEESATAQALLKNCIQLIDENKFPHIATSAHFLLSELYVPSDTDPAKPTFSEATESATSEEFVGESEVEVEAEDEDEVASSKEIHSLCHPFRLRVQDVEKSLPPPISSDVEFRCREALAHIQLGLVYLTKLEAINQAKEDSYRKERENIERDNIRMSVPNEPIPMGYIAPESTKLVRRTRSFSCGELVKLSSQGPKDMTTVEYLKFLLLKKAFLVYITLAEVSYDLEKYGRALKCIKRALNCQSMIQSLGGTIESKVTRDLVSFALGVAGDSYMAHVFQWQNLPLYQEQFNSDKEGEEGIAAEIEKYTEEIDRDWVIKQPKDIQESMELACVCYEGALTAENLPKADRNSLCRRMGNAKNELGVFYMNQATGLVEKVTDDEEHPSSDADACLMSRSAINAAAELLEKSRATFEIGIAYFKEIKDYANVALLLTNHGRIYRVFGHLKSYSRQKDEELSMEEIVEYKKSIDKYHEAIIFLGHRRTNEGVWDTVNWELCSTYSAMGTLLQDHAPLSIYTREEIEKRVTDYLQKSLKHCDFDNCGPRQIVYQYKAGVIHQRLASLYHHAYRMYGNSDTSNSRKKKMRQLSDLHYSKSAALYLQLDRMPDYLRSVMERAGLIEAGYDSSGSMVAKYKIIIAVLEQLCESKAGLERMSQPDQDADENGGEAAIMDSGTESDKSFDDEDEEAEMVALLLKRLQANLLNLYKLASARQPSKKDRDVEPIVIKQVYALSLKCKEESSKEVLDLLGEIREKILSR